MGYIAYSLTNSASLRNASPVRQPNGGYGEASLPLSMNMPGIYMIFNCQALPKTFHTGVSKNIGNELRHRLSSAAEMGFLATHMESIHVVWGSVQLHDEDPGLTPYSQRFGDKSISIPKPGSMGWRTAIPQDEDSFTASLDLKQQELRNILIRLVTRKLDAGDVTSTSHAMDEAKFPGVDDPKSNSHLLGLIKQKDPKAFNIIKDPRILAALHDAKFQKILTNPKLLQFPQILRLTAGQAQLYTAILSDTRFQRILATRKLHPFLRQPQFLTQPDPEIKIILEIAAFGVYDQYVKTHVAMPGTCL